MKFRKSNCPCKDFKTEKKIEETIYLSNTILKGLITYFKDNLTF